MATDAINVRQRLAADMKAVLAETEELLKATAGHTGDKIQSVRTRVEDVFRTASSRLEDFENQVEDKIKAVPKELEQAVVRNPLLSLGVSAGIGLVVGWLLGRK